MFKIFPFALLMVLIQMFGNPIGASAATNTSSAPGDGDFNCNLPAPANLQAGNIYPNGFTLTWDAVSGASGYVVSITNMTNGAVVFTSTTSGTSIAITGMDPATLYSCSTAPICAATGSSGGISTILVKTNFVVIDDIIVQYPPTPVPVKILSPDVPIDNFECLAVHYAGHYEYFRILTNTISLKVAHENQEFGQYGYPAGWYFGDNNNHIIPTNGELVATNDIAIYNLTKSVQSVPQTPDFSFTIGRVYGTGALRVNYNPTQYTIWQMDCAKKPGRTKGSYTNTFQSAETLTASPVPFIDQLQLKLSSALIETESAVQLMDANGRLVRQIFVGAGMSQLDIETNELSPGIYWVRHTAANAVQTVKVIKTE